MLSVDDIWVHDEFDFYKAQILIRMFDDPKLENHLPRPFGVFYETERACYEDILQMQVEETIAAKGAGDLDKLIKRKRSLGDYIISGFIFIAVK